MVMQIYSCTEKFTSVVVFLISDNIWSETFGFFLYARNSLGWEWVKFFQEVFSNNPVSAGM